MHNVKRCKVIAAAGKYYCKTSKLTFPSHQLSSEYTERTCGLCGNYNGNQGDDFLTPSGLVETLVEDFGNSWKLKGDCQDVQKQESNSCSLTPRLGTGP